MNKTFIIEESHLHYTFSFDKLPWKVQTCIMSLVLKRLDAKGIAIFCGCTLCVAFWFSSFSPPPLLLPICGVSWGLCLFYCNTVFRFPLGWLLVVVLTVHHSFYFLSQGPFTLYYFYPSATVYYSWLYRPHFSCQASIRVLSMDSLGALMKGGWLERWWYNQKTPVQSNENRWEFSKGKRRNGPFVI